jgi:PAS domain S-box-containing protein
MLGYSEVELTQHTWAELTHPDDLAADLAHFEPLLRGEIDRYELDKRLIRKGGESIAIHLTVACHRNAGRIQFIIAGILDISERKRAEEELKLAALLYQNSSEGITVTDANATILDVNPAFTRLSGYSPAEVIGKNPRLLQSGRHDPAILRELAQPFALGEASVQLSASIGIAFYPHDGSGVEALLANADQAMYEAKRQGRNRYYCFTPAAPEIAPTQHD